jgi:hypothetical protein
MKKEQNGHIRNIFLRVHRKGKLLFSDGEGRGNGALGSLVSGPIIIHP